MRVLGLKNCDKTRAAMKALAALGHDPVLVDVRAEPLGRRSARRSSRRLATVRSTAPRPRGAGCRMTKKPGQWPGFWRITRRF